MTVLMDDETDMCERTLRGSWVTVTDGRPETELFLIKGKAK